MLLMVPCSLEHGPCENRLLANRLLENQPGPNDLYSVESIFADDVASWYMKMLSKDPTFRLARCVGVFLGCGP